MSSKHLPILLAIFLSLAPGADAREPADAAGSQRASEPARRPPAVAEASSLLRLYVDEFPVEPWTVFGGFLFLGDQPAADLTPEGYADGSQVIADTTWEFQGNSSSILATSTLEPANAGASCYANFCGFRNPDNESYHRVASDTTIPIEGISAVDWDGAGTVFLRAAVTADLGAGRQRVCSDPADGHKEYPWLVFGQQDANGWYMEPGDAWDTEPWDCDQSVWLFGGDCQEGTLGTLLPELPLLEARISTRVIDTGTVSLPSGHHFNAILIEILQSSKVNDASCTLEIAETLTRQFLWLVPDLGPVMFMGTGYDPDNPDSWAGTLYTLYGVALYPPVDIWIEETGPDWVRIGWDPGAFPDFHTGYKVYWDTDSGADSDYAFNSEDFPAQVDFDGTTATISGISDCGARYFTVTTLVDHQDPDTGWVTPYESFLFPKQVVGDPDHAYPIEVQGSATGGFTVEISTVPSPPAICGAGSFDLSATPGYDSDLWSDGQTGPVIQVSIDSDTRVSVEALDATSGCTARAGVDLRVDHPPIVGTASAVDENPCDSGILVSWEPAVFQNPDGTGFYNVYRSEVSCDDALQAPPVATGLMGPDWVDPDATPDTPTYYVVEAEDSRPDSPCPGGAVAGGAASTVCISVPVTDTVDDIPPAAEVGNSVRADPLVKDTDTVRFYWDDTLALEPDEKFWVGRTDDPGANFRSIGRGPPLL